MSLDGGGTATRAVLTAERTHLFFLTLTQLLPFLVLLIVLSFNIGLMLIKYYFFSFIMSSQLI